MMIVNPQPEKVVESLVVQMVGNLDFDFMYRHPAVEQDDLIYLLRALLEYVVHSVEQCT